MKDTNRICLPWGVKSCSRHVCVQLLCVLLQLPWSSLHRARRTQKIRLPANLIGYWAAIWLFSFISFVKKVHWFFADVNTKTRVSSFCPWMTTQWTSSCSSKPFSQVVQERYCAVKCNCGLAQLSLSKSATNPHHKEQSCNTRWDESNAGIGYWISGTTVSLCFHRLERWSWIYVTSWMIRSIDQMLNKW